MIFGLNLVDIALVIIIGIVLFFAIRGTINRKNKSSCCGNCSSCSYCTSNKKPKK